MVLPRQRSSNYLLERAEASALATAVSRLAMGELVVFENGTVFALAGDARNPNLQAQIKEVKGDNRAANQPVGWIAPYAGALKAVDYSHVKDPAMKKFLENPDSLTRRLGGLAFLRIAANLKYKRHNDMPDAIIPDLPSPQVQIFSPTGNERLSRLSRYASAQGICLAMTSANKSGRPEIIELDEARQFAAAGNPPLLVVPDLARRSRQDMPRGSYPILSVEPDRFTVSRAGFVEPVLLQRLMYDQPVDIDSRAIAPANFVRHTLRHNDLPVDAQSLRGDELHDALLATFAK